MADRSWFGLKKVEESAQDEPKTDETQNQPSFVTKEEFQSLSTKLDTLTGFLQQPRTEPQPKEPKQPALPPIDDVDDSEIESAWRRARESGEDEDYSRARTLERRRDNARFERYRREQEQRLTELQTQGMERFGQINARMARDALKNKADYGFISKEVEERIGQVPPEQLTVEVAEHIYNMVRGEKADEIWEKRAERAAREKAKATTPEGGQQNGREQSQAPPVTFQSVFGERISAPDAQWPTGGDLWQGRHETPDQFAKQLGYNDGTHYARVAQYVMQAQQCTDCFMDVLPNEEHTCPVRSKQRLINFPPELQFK